MTQDKSVGMTVGMDTNVFHFYLTLIYHLEVLFWPWIQIRSQILSFLMITDPDLNPEKCKIVTPLEVLSFQARIQIQRKIFSLLAIPNPFSDPVKNGIVTPLLPTPH